jgi:hypothetical protein
MIASNNNPFEDIPDIYNYSRGQAIEDGVLLDLSAWAKETCFTIPVACTAVVWHKYVVPPGDTQKLGRSERGRAHDLLHMLYVAIRKQPGTSDRLLYEVICLDAAGKPQAVTLKAICGPGDQGEPVMTIMLIDED